MAFYFETSPRQGEHHIQSAKRLGVTVGNLGPDWYASWSPRNSSDCAEGLWCHWVHLARLILADERTRREMPAHYQPYPDAPYVDSGCHPDCTTTDTTKGGATNGDHI